MQLDENAMDILKELGNIGTGNAVNSLSQMMNNLVEIDIPSLRVVHYQEICTVLNQAEELQTGIMVEVSGDLEGMFLFLLTESFTRSVLETILGDQKRDILKLDEMERSLICELGNIMCGSYIRALAQLLQMDMDVSVPDLCIDMGGAILSVPLSRFLKVSDEVLLIENLFHMGGQNFIGRILFLPELSSLERMLNRFGE